MSSRWGSLKDVAARAREGLAVAAGPRSVVFAALSGTRLDRSPERLGAFRFRSLPFSARAADWLAVREVLVEREYGFVADVLAGSRAPVVVDVGANIGTFALFVFSLFPDAVVRSFEPSSTTFVVLDANRRANPGLDWSCQRAAAHAADGTAPFVNAPFTTSSRLGAGGDEDVPTLSLDSIVTGPVDLLKLDVEGAEEAVLDGREDVLRRVGSVVVEVHPDRCDEQRVVRVLESVYEHVRAVAGRRSTKPLLVAT